MTNAGRLVFVSALWCAVGGAAAQAIGDPTQPSAIGAGGAVPVNGTDAAQTPAGPVLQAIVLERHRKYAVINGNTVKLGGTFEGARLTRISDSEVTLKNGTDLTVLKLFPDVTKTPSADGRNAKRAKPAQASPQ